MDILVNELTTDPLARGYSGMTDQQVADSLNTFDREGDAEPGALFRYMVTNQAKDYSSEEAATTLYGRLKRVVEAGSAVVEATSPNNRVFGKTIDFSELTYERLDAAVSLLAIVDQDRLETSTIKAGEVGLDDLLQHAQRAGCWRAADTDAMVAFSNNRQSRAQELGLGRVKVGQIIHARS